MKTSIEILKENLLNPKFTGDKNILSVEELDEFMKDEFYRPFISAMEQYLQQYIDINKFKPAEEKLRESLNNSKTIK